ncbi:carboxypeptidase B2-like isoform X2 [Plectropomus leopardus]|uniref:carboxypeptidase B2-like isoform X2 n=1 Tax=Plectropomus leopardus TaxID=160734 RepID=UPI001C4ACF41|nr:carboxypeptidase B2-like isoform X2 [Plectropomus leopardus]
MKTLLILFVLMNLDKLLKTGDCTEARDQILSITPKTQEQVDLMRNISDHYRMVLCHQAAPENIKEETDVQVYVPAIYTWTMTGLLQKHAMIYKVLVADVSELIEMQKRSDSAYRSIETFYESYHTLEDIYNWINETRQNNPDTVEVIQIGSSFENRPLYVMKLSLNNRPNKKAMWIDCGIHAREWISHAFCLWFVQYSLSSYKTNQNMTHIFDNMDVYVLPVVNPDGYEYSWTTDRMWRKNRSVRNSSHCIGVDLNRNFDANWCMEEASKNPCRDLYCGASPESEPETQAVANFLRSHKDSIQLYLTIHAPTKMLLFPYSYTFEEAENHKDLYEMAQEAAENIKTIYNTTYTYGQGSKTIYLASGGSDDWAYDLGIKYSFTFELMGHRDDGFYGFLLPPSEITRACNEALIGVRTIALKVIEKTQAPTSPPPSA